MVGVLAICALTMYRLLVSVVSWTLKKAELSAARAREAQRKRGEIRLMVMAEGGGDPRGITERVSRGYILVNLCAGERGNGHLGDHESV